MIKWQSPIDRLRYWLHIRRQQRTPCNRGGWQHESLVWKRNNSSKRLGKIAAQNDACEMMIASGFGSLMMYIGYCQRCGRAVEWSSQKPPRRRAA